MLITRTKSGMCKNATRFVGLRRNDFWKANCELEGREGELRQDVWGRRGSIEARG